MHFSWKISKNQLIFGLLYSIFIFSEQVADDGSVLARLSNTVDSLKIKYMMAVLAIGILLLRYIRNPGRFVRFRDEAKNVLLTTVILSTITVIKQMQNGFMGASYNEVFFWLVPIIYVYFLVNCINDIKPYMDTAFIIQLIFFFIDIMDKLSIKNILAINFITSNSAFESEYSFYGLVFFMFYLFMKDKRRAVLSLFMTILAFKRMAVVFALVVLIMSVLQTKRGTFNKTPSPRGVFIVTVLFIIVPIGFHLICSDSFGSWFYSVTGLNFNAFISGRLERLNLCIDNEMRYGLGSSTQFLNEVLGRGFSRNLHNDVLRIYLECGIIGTIAFTYDYFKMASKSRMSFMLMLYLFTDMMFNHFLGAGRTAFWIIIYLAICSFNEASRASSWLLEEYK